EPDQKGGGPDRAPEDDGPAVRSFDEARESSAEAPHEGGKKDKEVAKTFLPSRNGRLKRGGWRNSVGHGTNVCSSSARLLLQTRRPSPYSRNPRPVKLREPAPSVRWGTCRRLTGSRTRSGPSPFRPVQAVLSPGVRRAPGSRSARIAGRPDQRAWGRRRAQPSCRPLGPEGRHRDRKSTRLNSSHVKI